MRCHGNGRARGALGTAAAAENKHESDASRTCCGARGHATRALRGVRPVMYVIIVSGYTGDVFDYSEQRFSFY